MELKVITRQEAREQGLKRYFTGIPCVNKHITERNVREGKCVKCLSIRMRSDYLANREKRIEYRKNHYDKNKDEISIKQRLFYLENIDKIKLKYKLYCQNNKEKISQRGKKYYLDNKEARNKYRDQWRIDNRWKVRFYNNNRKKRIKRATPSWLNEFQWNAIREVYRTCPEGWHVDHIEPIMGRDVCGLHVPWNLQHLPASENIAKGCRPVR